MWMKKKIQISKKYSQEEREAIAFELIDKIIERTKKGIDRKGNQFPSYSDSYTGSLDFKIAGKSKNKINLTLSGDMLADLQLLNHDKGEIVIGFENGSDSNAKAEGNIKGTYGQKTSTGKKRDFLGVQEKELREVLEKYPLDDFEKRQKRTQNINDLISDVDLISGRIILDELQEEWWKNR